jgi:hypothetical protein
VQADGRRLVVARTPPTGAVYHRFDNPLFTQAIDVLGRDASVRVLALPRHADQRAALEALGYENLVVPAHAVDSRSLMYHADLVLGAGGTMTREAALMGVPTRSLFAGEQPAVDGELERKGLLMRLNDAEELASVAPRADPPRTLQELRERASGLVETFVEAIRGAA